MQIVPIHTHKITSADTDIYAILDAYVPDVPEGSVLAITSKVISITQGRIVPTSEIDKDTLVEQEADLFLKPTSKKFHYYITIKHNILIANAGIDESNANGTFVLWPKHPQEVVNTIREYLVKRFGRKHIGVILTDSKLSPLRWGVTGVSLAHSGFAALNNYIGVADIFGRPLEVTRVSVVDSLAASAVFSMGEGKEQTPLALLTDLPNVHFQERNPTEQEIADLGIALEDDLYASLLTSVAWEKKKK